MTTAIRPLRAAAFRGLEVVAEAGGRFGGDRVQHFPITYGSLRETRCLLAIDVAKGWLKGNCARGRIGS